MPNNEGNLRVQNRNHVSGMTAIDWKLATNKRENQL